MSQEWRKTKKYRLWSAAVKRRDKVCQISACGRRKTGHAHHIKNASHHPELRFDVDNGIRLCERCHYMVHNVVKSSYRRKTNGSDIAILQAIGVMTAKLPEMPQHYRKNKGRYKDS